MIPRVLTPPESANGLAGHANRARLFSFGRAVTALTASRHTLRCDPPRSTQGPCAVLAGPLNCVREGVKTTAPTHCAPQRRLTMAKSKNNKNA
ncbi:hypothetical protein CBM2609_B10271 [Cupriavidus taiwanensis]|nr:hypothetical protein CBM2604_B10269 [Cupriavidus taiwanensis]SOZ30219.1 hypothetical protein CBM2609_B10271 [Cupriavidus taiwanensis]SOZ47117.1 hypothetical protein CBM2610_B10270 [Cupriavidus taiwanensis]